MYFKRQFCSGLFIPNELATYKLAVEGGLIKLRRKHEIRTRRAHLQLIR